MENIEITTPASMMSNSCASKDEDCSRPDVNEEEATTMPTLTARQVELINSTWKVVRDEVTFDVAGMILFKKLFEIAPNLMDLFPFKNDSDRDAGMKKHGIQVMTSIDGAISLLGNSQELEDTLIELGIIHNMKQVQLGSFAPVGEALVYTLGIGLGDKFTNEVQTAWITLYTIVQHFMTLGMNEGLDV